MAGPRTDDPVALRAATTALAPPDAWSRLRAHCTPLPSEDVPIAQAGGRTTAETVCSSVALPRETNSAMDGFGVRAADGPHDRAPIVGEARAGQPFVGELPAGAVIRIATGGAVPDGVDAVVRIEDALLDGDRATLPAAPLHDNIRFAGEDLPLGGELVARGTRLASHHLVALAAAGVAAVPCHRRPVVTVVVTGDEVVAPGEPVGPGQVTDTHGIALPELVRQAGGAVGEIVHAPDGRSELSAVLGGLAPADIVLVTGGLSVGRHDHTRPVLDALGVELFVERLLLRPGQPTAIGARRDSGQLWFGLPGNPVSAFAIARLFLVPAIRALSGAGPAALRGDTAVLSAPARPDATRWLALRGVRDGEGVRVLQGQGSHMVAALANAGVLVLLRPAGTPLPAGASVDVLDLDPPGLLA